MTAKLSLELSADVMKNDPILAGFRELHSKIGKSNRRFPAASESLIGYFLSKGEIPAINPIVDIYNMLSLDSRLSLGAHDTDKVDGNIVLRLTDGSERFVPLGATEPVAVTSGEYCYIDDANDILCRLEHKQVEKTKVTDRTNSCFFIIQGNASTPASLLEKTTNRLAGLLAEHCKGVAVRSWLFA